MRREPHEGRAGDRNLVPKGSARCDVLVRARVEVVDRHSDTRFDVARHLRERSCAPAWRQHGDGAPFAIEALAERRALKVPEIKLSVMTEIGATPRRVDLF